MHKIVLYINNFQYDTDVCLIQSKILFFFHETDISVSGNEWKWPRHFSECYSEGFRSVLVSEPSPS